MKKLLSVILVICSLLGCNAYAEKFDEYECYGTDGSGPVFYAIADDYIIIDYMESDQRKEKIKVETSDKITFGNDSLFHITFYKRTNKILERYSTGGNYVFKCDKLN